MSKYESFLRRWSSQKVTHISIHAMLFARDISDGFLCRFGVVRENPVYGVLGFTCNLVGCYLGGFMAMVSLVPTVHHVLNEAQALP